jgi:hypothetical protein
METATEKIKCSLQGCDQKVVGGFHEEIAAGFLGNPSATVPGMSTYWCAEHESAIRPHTIGKRGRIVSM